MQVADIQVKRAVSIIIVKSRGTTVETMPPILDAVCVSSAVVALRITTLISRVFQLNYGSRIA